MFVRYSPPNENNTFWISGRVTEVYHALPKGVVVVAMSNGEVLQLVYPTGIWELQSAIGCDVDQLANLLEGEEIRCRRMKQLSWAVEIEAGDTIVDNSELTTQQMVVTREAIVVFGMILLAICIGCEVTYLHTKYRCYLKMK